MKPRSINIFLLDGDPNGIRVAQIMMSTIQAIAFRRNKLGEVRKTFPEIERPGVYILIGEDENEPDRQLEPPRVWRRVFCSKLRRRDQEHLCSRRRFPPLLAAADSQ